jgi:ABC-type taurine transport system substrate-binding protein
MISPRRIPVFATESEEADWWYEHREELGDELVAAIRSGQNGIGSLGRAKLRAAAAEAEAEAKKAKTGSRAA